MSVDAVFEKPSWPHAPVHRLSQSGTYFVTAGTYGKEHHFKARNRLTVLQNGLLKVTFDAGWKVEAWAIFSNHYHFVGHSPHEENGAESLRSALGLLHEKTAKWVNRLDGTRGRKVWHSYWETQLTFEKSYLARLNYTHQNPVKHRLVKVASHYPWCSAGWFERTATRAQVKTIYGFRTDRVHVRDDYEPSPDW